jgi:hypothetical protein
MLSSLVFITFMPLQISPSGHIRLPITRPLALAAFVDSARIIGLPRLKLRDSNGRPYLVERTLLQEPLAIVHDSAGVIFPAELNNRKAYIQSYVRR